MSLVEIVQIDHYSEEYSNVISGNSTNKSLQWTIQQIITVNNTAMSLVEIVQRNGNTKGVIRNLITKKGTLT